MIDIKGIEIKPGMTVKTTQYSGGILPTGKPTTGIVEETTDAFGMPALQIRFREPWRTFDQFVIIDHHINEIINH